MSEMPEGWKKWKQFEKDSQNPYGMDATILLKEMAEALEKISEDRDYEFNEITDAAQTAMDCLKKFREWK